MRGGQAAAPALFNEASVCAVSLGTKPRGIKIVVLLRQGGINNATRTTAPSRPWSCS